MPIDLSDNVNQEFGQFWITKEFGLGLGSSFDDIGELITELFEIIKGIRA